MAPRNPKMAPRNKGLSTTKAAKETKNKGAWTAEEDMRLSQYIELYGPRKWKTISLKAGLNRCGKSCRLRWLNYLRPNIKRGNISLEEEDLIIRLHKLLGNRWSLIAGRIPGRTDNEIKNYWNSHLSKKLKCQEDNKAKSAPSPSLESSPSLPPNFPRTSENNAVGPSSSETETSFDLDNFFDFSAGGTCALEWDSEFLELDVDDSFGFP